MIRVSIGDFPVERPIGLFLDHGELQVSCLFQTLSGLSMTLYAVAFEELSATGREVHLLRERILFSGGVFRRTPLWILLIVDVLRQEQRGAQEERKREPLHHLPPSIRATLFPKPRIS